MLTFSRYNVRSLARNRLRVSFVVPAELDGTRFESRLQRPCLAAMRRFAFGDKAALLER